MSETIKIKIPDGDELNKSLQDQERELVNKHREENGDEPIDSDDTIKINLNEGDQGGDNPPAVDNKEEEEGEEGDENVVIDDETIFRILSEKTGKEVKSLEDLIEVREKEVELDEAVAAFKEYRERTGRSLKDYMEYTKDYNSMSDEEVVMMSLRKSMEGFDEEDIQFQFESDYSYDEYDDENAKRSKQLKLKKAAQEARQLLNSEKEQFNLPLESSRPLVPEEEQENYQNYLQYKEGKSAQEQEIIKRQTYFSDKTKELFSDKFEGFEFKSGDNSFKYKPGESNELLEKHLDIEKSFLSKHVGEDGLLKDPVAYHKALSVAMDPQAFFDYALELGKSIAIEEATKKSKNIDMETKPVTNVVNHNGIKVTDTTGGQKTGFRIRKRR